MLGTPYMVQAIAEMSYAIDLFQGQEKGTLIRYISFDSRNIHHGPETLFIALKTENRDGHDYIQSAYDKGVRNFMVEKKVDLAGINYILCHNTLDSLQYWAKHHRQRFSCPVILITGSNGKTIVKEWLTSLLELDFQVYKSPMSYNSQLGVAISLLGLHPQSDIALVEAGISKPGEMETLREMIQPSAGILTHMGDAHSEGFSSFSEKLTEKCLAFEEVEKVWVNSFQNDVIHDLKEKDLPIVSIGREKSDLIQIHQTRLFDGNWQIEIDIDGEKKIIDLPLSSQAALENVLLSILVAREHGVPWNTIIGRVALLRPIEMRMELITDNPEITLINDSYNSDLASIQNAFQYLREIRSHEKKHIILSDLQHIPPNKEQVHQEILKDAIALVGKEQVRTVGPHFLATKHPFSYPNIQALQADLTYADFRDSTVLLKGARKFALESLIPFFNPKQNTTYFQIDLDKLSHNYRQLKRLVPDGTKTMCMVKAYSYGSGSWEIAKVLEEEGADYLGVAYASEGIELRKAGIRVPIMVMNADLSSIPSLLEFDIEPEVYSFSFLEKYLQTARLSSRRDYKIHLKFETGMGRLGFRENELDKLISIISQHPDLVVVSLMSHLAAADLPPENAFSQKQIQAFTHICKQFYQKLGVQPLRHILNTAGILAFPQAAMDMVRMGIGLYGISPFKENTVGLMEIGSWHSRISQIKIHKEGETIGYGRSQVLKKDSLIATVPVGYADGVPRNVGNGKAKFLVHGKKVPTVGRICMDMLMLDVSDVRSVREGDEVVLFGQQNEEFLSVNELAKSAQTIPYEILVRIGMRVRRIFVR